MSPKPSLEPQRIREEIAMAAARMIAEEGADYGTAKQKAARNLLGETRIAGELLPDNAQIEDEVRAYQALFQSDTQPAILRVLREAAIMLMDALSTFSPHLAGAVLNGTAHQHSDIHLQLFCDNPKDVAFALLNAGLDFDAHETPHFSSRRDSLPVETLSFLWTGQPPGGADARQLARKCRELLGASAGVHLAIYPTDDLRGALRPGLDGRVKRAAIEHVRALLD